MNRISYLVLLAACSTSSASQPAATASLPAGWHRVDLSTSNPPIAATVAVPEGLAMSSHVAECNIDPKQPSRLGVVVTIELADRSHLQISTCSAYFDEKEITLPGTLKHHLGREITGTDKLATGEWAVSFVPKPEFPSDPKVGDYVVGWSPRAHVKCQAFAATDAASARRICTSIAPNT